ncbi:uncharacterized protein SPSK_01290 [Sporothrix schenckii 1099-18]|uniref:Uncharacterized protein n=1 Tax=Sporothrix schenckii 1099-18 TaxID=1397361 RepID=A0A0F2LVD5_SPOSC|nr:uncharacterized protein SPSK_01290 [Sporothrix schenckii 1099-18]KJR81428.1 hypothetical protein SPSK_01290 [Sporothrix schenckii 1099-18]
MSEIPDSDADETMLEIPDSDAADNLTINDTQSNSDDEEPYITCPPTPFSEASWVETDADYEATDDDQGLELDDSFVYGANNDDIQEHDSQSSSQTNNNFDDNFDVKKK